MPKLHGQEYEVVPIDSLQMHPDNPRRGNNAMIAESIDVNGFYGAIICQKSTRRILAGNHRWQNLKAAGDQQIPVIWLDVTDQEALKILLADNKTNDAAGYDKSALSAALAKLEDLAGTGYSATEYDRIIARNTEPDASLDELPAKPKSALRDKWQTETGQVWQVGNHRLAIGSATDQATWDALLAGEQVDLITTDPPYGVDVNTGWAPGYRRQDGLKVTNDTLKDEALAAFLLAAFQRIHANAKAGSVIYVCHAEGCQIDLIFREAFKAADFYSAGIIIWLKNSFVLSRQDYHWRHEPIIYGWKPQPDESKVHFPLTLLEPPADIELGHDTILYGWKRGAGHYWCGDRDQDTVWDIARPSRSKEHPTMKPVELILRMIRNSSRAGDIVADPFIGSGTTMIACEQSQRQCRAIELEPEYAAVVLERMAMLYEHEPTLVQKRDRSSDPKPKPARSPRKPSKK